MKEIQLTPETAYFERTWIILKIQKLNKVPVSLRLSVSKILQHVDPLLGNDRKRRSYTTAVAK
jgi:hypothetical protein